MNLALNLVAVKTIIRKEMVRVLRIWVQTIVPPAITMTLYFIIFGNLIGRRIGQMDGFDRDSAEIEDRTVVEPLGVHQSEEVFEAVVRGHDEGFVVRRAHRRTGAAARVEERADAGGTREAVPPCGLAGDQARHLAQ